MKKLAIVGFLFGLATILMAGSTDSNTSSTTTINSTKPKIKYIDAKEMKEKIKNYKVKEIVEG